MRATMRYHGARRPPVLERATAASASRTANMRCCGEGPGVTERIRLLVADDHAVLRAGLRALLGAEADMVVVGEAANGEEAVARARALVPDVILMDLSLPGMDGFEATRRVKEALPGVRVLILTMYEDDGYLAKALEAGAAGYVPKKAVDIELLSAIRAVHRGDAYLHPSLAQGVVDGFLSKRRLTLSPLPEEERQGDPLSRREREVLRLIAIGYTNQEIADTLLVSVKTVETHKARLMSKLNLRRRSELVRYALEEGLAP